MRSFFFFFFLEFVRLRLSTFFFFFVVLHPTTQSTMKTTITDKAGRVTAYGFACGYMEKTDTAQLTMQHGTYLVQGWNAKGERVDFGTRSIKEARKALHATK